MTNSLAEASLAVGSHVCWSVRSADDFVREAEQFLAAAAETNEKTAAFGPARSTDLAALRSRAAIVADPYEAFLGRGELRPETMFAMFDEQSKLARDEGFSGLRLVADMDWLLPARPSTDEVVAFELLLDRHARKVGATIVCAYRDRSFDAAGMTGARCVHPIGVGDEVAPQFVMSAGDDGWSVSGEVDVAVESHFATAIRAALDGGGQTLDATGLTFIDVGGMRTIADAARSHGEVRVVGASRVFRRAWSAAFEDLAPSVTIVN